MRSIAIAEQALAGGDYDAALTRAYSRAQLTEQRARWNALLERACAHPFFRDTAHPPRLFRSPGRTEIGGNHTDHNHGLAIVGTLCSDIIALLGLSDKFSRRCGLRINSLARSLRSST